MKTQTSPQSFDNYCSVREQRHLVSEMTHCDQAAGNNNDRYECYLSAVKESRENNACMFS